MQKNFPTKQLRFSAFLRIWYPSQEVYKLHTFRQADVQTDVQTDKAILTLYLIFGVKPCEWLIFLTMAQICITLMHLMNVGTYM